MADVVDRLRCGEELLRPGIEHTAHLSDGDPLRLWVVMDEVAIRRVVGGPAVMHEQLDRLLVVMKLPNVSLRILPTGAGVHAAMGAPFSVLRLEEAGSQAVYLESLWSVEVLDQPAQVQAYVRSFDRLSAAALDRSSTAGMIEEAMGELR